jgi:hypothetical protein
MPFWLHASLGAAPAAAGGIGGGAGWKLMQAALTLISATARLHPPERNLTRMMAPG